MIEDADDPEPRSTSDVFHDEITAKIDYFRKEYSLTYAEAVGVLEMVKHRLLCESEDDFRDDSTEEVT